MQLELDLVSHFHADPRAEWIDSCSDGEDSTSAHLYPDRRGSQTLLLPLHGLSGTAATRLHPALTGAKDRLRVVRQAAGRRVHARRNRA